MINHKEILNYKENCRNEEGGIDMCQAIIEMIEEGREAGLEAGKLDGIKLIITNMHQKGYTNTEISEITGVPMEQIHTVETNLNIL